MDRVPFHVAGLANAINQRLVRRRFDRRQLAEARRLIDEAIRDLAPDERESVAQSIWAVAVEIYAASGDEARMNEAISHLRWESPALEAQDRRYYRQLLARGREHARRR